MNTKFRIILLSLLISVVYGQENKEPDFNLMFGLKYLNQFYDHGISLSGDSPAISTSTSLSHKSGLYTNFNYVVPINTDENAQQFALDIGFEYEFNDKLNGSVEYSSHMFSSDSLHLFSQYSNSISIGADLELDIVDIGVSYDRYLGEADASYFSIDVSKFLEVGPVYLLPLLQAVFISQEVDMSYLEKTKSKGKKSNNSADFTTNTTTISGLSNTTIALVTVYPIYKGINLSFAPSLILYHNDQLSDDWFKLAWNAGIRYRIKF